MDGLDWANNYSLTRQSAAISIPTDGHEIKAFTPV
jgi:hypothetical protein